MLLPYLPLFLIAYLGLVVQSHYIVSNRVEQHDLDSIESHDEIDADRSKRTAPVTKYKKWDKTAPIPISLDGEFTYETVLLIKNVHKTIAEHTCLSFVEPFDELTDGEKLTYKLGAPGSGCDSVMGDRREELGVQTVNLAPDCHTERVIMHETIHALGFHHTQARTDRDDYLIIDKKNIKSDELNNFELLTTNDSATNFGIPYEYNSVMHYFPFTGFEIDDRFPAIGPIDPDYSNVIGGKVPTFNDWKFINLYYECKESCTDKIECENGGYQHPRRCEECVCPQFYTGRNCEEAYDEREFTIGNFFAIDYSPPADLKAYLNDDSLEKMDPLILRAPENALFSVTIYEISDSEPNCDHRCEKKGFEVVDGDLTRVGKRFCCNPQRDSLDEYPYTFTSTTNVIGVLLYSKKGLDFTVNATITVIDAVEEATDEPEPSESPIDEDATDASTTQEEEGSATGEPEDVTEEPHPEEIQTTDGDSTVELTTAEPQEETSTELPSSEEPETNPDETEVSQATEERTTSQTGQPEVESSTTNEPEEATEERDTEETETTDGDQTVVPTTEEPQEQTNTELPSTNAPETEEATEPSPEGSSGTEESQTESATESTLTPTDEPLCNSEDLRALILANVDSNPNASRKLIKSAAEAQFGGRFDVICARADIAYSTNSELFCHESKHGVSCYAFRHS